MGKGGDGGKVFKGGERRCGHRADMKHSKGREGRGTGGVQLPWIQRHCKGLFILTQRLLFHCSATPLIQVMRMNISFTEESHHGSLMVCRIPWHPFQHRGVVGTLL